MISGTLTNSNTTVTAPETARCSKAAFMVGDGDGETWDGATVIMEMQHQQSDQWEPITDASWTANATGILECAPAWKLRFSISGGGGSESVTVRLSKID